MQDLTLKISTEGLDDFDSLGLNVQKKVYTILKKKMLLEKREALAHLHARGPHGLTEEAIDKIIGQLLEIKISRALAEDARVAYFSAKSAVPEDASPALKACSQLLRKVVKLEGQSLIVETSKVHIVFRLAFTHPFELNRKRKRVLVEGTADSSDDVLGFENIADQLAAQLHKHQCEVSDWETFLKHAQTLAQRCRFPEDDATLKSASCRNYLQLHNDFKEFYAFSAPWILETRTRARTRDPDAEAAIERDQTNANGSK